MSTTIARKERTALARVDTLTRQLDRRVVRARESFNEKVKRAEAEYWDALRRALAVEEEDAPRDEAAPTPA